jgi:hypothetical protein
MANATRSYEASRDRLQARVDGLTERIRNVTIAAETSARDFDASKTALVQQIANLKSEEQQVRSSAVEGGAYHAAQICSGARQ